MTTYKLIKCYPASLELNSEVSNIVNNKYQFIDGYLVRDFDKDTIENNPEYWELQWKDLTLDEWLEEAKKLNLSKKDLEYKLNYEMSSYFYNKLEGKYTEDKAEILYNKWNPEPSLDYKVLLWSYGQKHGFKTTSPEGTIDAYQMYTVQRLSDGKEFTIGDSTNAGIIRGFKLSTVDSKRLLVVFEPAEGSHPNCYVKLSVLKKTVVKKILFITEDKKEVYKKTLIYPVDIETLRIFPKVYGKAADTSVKRFIWFFSKENAENYIYLNKPCLSLNDVLKNVAFKDTGTFIHELMEIVINKTT